MTILRFLFGRSISCLREIGIDVPNGVMLYKSLTPNESIKNIDLVLETVDDLYVLLDGLVPNVEKLVIHLRQPRRLCKYL